MLNQLFAISALWRDGLNSIASNFILYGLVAVSISLFWLMIHPLYLSSLSHIPGPIPAALSWFYLSYFDLCLRRNRTIHYWFSRYGPVVRIRPNEIAVADRTVFRHIYQGKSQYDKSDYFKRFTHEGHDCLFSITSYADHQARRRKIAGVYTKSTVIRNAEAFVKERAQALLEQIALQPEASVNFLSLWGSFALDNITRYLYGISRGTHSIEKGTYRDLVTEKQRSRIWAPVSINFPWFHGTWVSKLLLKEDYVASLDTGRKVAELASNLMAEEDEDPERDSYESVSKALRNSQCTDIANKKGDVASELLDHLVAGVETTASNLTYITWRLARDTDWQTRLREELRYLEKAEDGSYTYATLEDCSVLDAVVRETLRSHPVSSGRLERLVPKGGRSYSGVFVPENTVVVGSQLALHGNEVVFPQPDKWMPERWLEASDEDLKDMERSFVPFGYGGRICIGRHLAMLEVKTAIAALFTRFEISLHQSCSDESMESLDTLASVPRALKCVLVARSI